MKREELKEILRLHELWLANEDGGKNADLRGTDLRGADLREANLRYADLVNADLSGVKTSYKTTGYFPVCPKGEIIGYKKCRNDVIVKLLIPKDAKRSSATTRKCRCDKAVVLEIDGGVSNRLEKYTKAFSRHDSDFIYEVGKTVEVDDFDDDRWNECSTGIHFFLTREEAENY